MSGRISRRFQPPQLRTLVAVTFGAAATVVAVASPAVRFAYRSPDGRLVLETVASLIAGLVSFLLYGRFRRTHSRQALLLVYALGLLAVAAFGFVVLPTLAGADLDSANTTWAPLVVRFAAALLLFAAALLPDRSTKPGTHVSWHALAFIVLLVGVGLVVEVLAAELPTAVATRAPPEASGVVSFEAHPVVLGVQGGTLLCFAVAAFTFTRQASRTGDDFAGWIGAACAVGAWARVNYLLFPSLYSGWLYIGDLLRLGFYVLLLVGAVREVQAYWAAQAESAVAAERRRLARELHDGAQQEIGFIRTQMRSVEGPVAEHVRSAAERALDEMRAALAAMTAPAAEPLADLLRRRLGEVADRYGVQVQWSLDDSDDLPAGHRESLVRVAREALVNAARHSGAKRVEVHLRPGELVICDHGAGFDVSAPQRVGAFGLVSMRERAMAIGGSLEINSTPQTGTEVRLTWTPN